MARKAVDIELNVHLMMKRPDLVVDAFVDAGANSILIHVESESDIDATLNQIRAAGVIPGLVINPDTPAKRIVPYIDSIDIALCMTVFPGYGGQSFIPEVLTSIKEMRFAAEEHGKDIDIIVDGGINNETGVQCAQKGANVLVAGTFLYGSPDMKIAIAEMRQLATTQAAE